MIITSSPTKQLHTKNITYLIPSSLPDAADETVIFWTDTSLHQPIWGVVPVSKIWELTVRERLATGKRPDTKGANLHREDAIPACLGPLLYNSWEWVAMQLVAHKFDRVATLLGPEAERGVIVTFEQGDDSQHRLHLRLREFPYTQKSSPDRSTLAFAPTADLMRQLLGEILQLRTVFIPQIGFTPIRESDLLPHIPQTRAWVFQDRMKTNTFMLYGTDIRVGPGRQPRVFARLDFSTFVELLQSGSTGLVRPRPYHTHFQLPTKPYYQAVSASLLPVRALYAQLHELLENSWEQLDEAIIPERTLQKITFEITPVNGSTAQVELNFEHSAKQTYTDQITIALDQPLTADHLIRALSDKK